MSDVAVTFRILALDGTTLILDVSPANGYETTRFENEGETFDTVKVSSRFVDGTWKVQSTLAEAKFAWGIRVRGSSWVQVEQRRVALRNALRTWRYLLEQTVEGVTTVWRCDTEMMLNPLGDAVNIQGKRRDVVVSVTAQPNPSIAGI